MTDKRITALSHVSVDEISVVDDGANPEAKVLIIKNKSGAAAGHKACKGCKTPDECMKKGKCSEPDGDEQMKKALAAISAVMSGDNGDDTMNLDELTDALEKAKTALDTAAADIAKRDERIAALEADIAKAKKPEDKGEDKGEDDVLKALPEAIRKRLVDAEESAKAATAVVQKMQAEREVAEAIVKAKSAGMVEPDVTGPILHRVAKGCTTAADATELERVLKAAAAQAKAGGVIFKSIGAAGGDGGDDGDPEALLKAKAKEIAAAEKISIEKAYSLALERNPDLYESYLNKRRA